MRVIVTGRLKQRSYETRDGQQRTVVELDVDEIGPSLKYATAKVTRTQRSGGGFGGGAPSAPSGGDPWSTAPAGQPAGGQAGGPAAAQGDPWAAGEPADEPPF
jgi:single-strand DNA-binding protein